MTTEPAPAQGAQQPTLAQLANAYFADFQGRDDSRPHRIAWWVARLGERIAATITDDDVFHALEELAATPARRYAGKDVEGKKIFRPRAERRSASTLNRYQVALSALFSWAISKRRLPKGWKNPCNEIERRTEPKGRTRFLSDLERSALIEACRASDWERLYLLVLMAITTGARRGELMALTWRDLDLERGCAHICTTKNGDRRVLPLTPAVVDELERYQAGAGSLIFPSKAKPTVPFNFEDAWRLARARARLKDFRFHDLRHTTASYLAQDGASLLEIADVLGHRTLAMVQRYAHLTTKSKATLVNRVLGDIR